MRALGASWALPSLPQAASEQHRQQQVMQLAGVQSGVSPSDWPQMGLPAAGPLSCGCSVAPLLAAGLAVGFLTRFLFWLAPMPGRGWAGRLHTTPMHASPPFFKLPCICPIVPFQQPPGNQNLTPPAAEKTQEEKKIEQMQSACLWQLGSGTCLTARKKKKKKKKSSVEFRTRYGCWPYPAVPHSATASVMCILWQYRHQPSTSQIGLQNASKTSPASALAATAMPASDDPKHLAPNQPTNHSHATMPGPMLLKPLWLTPSPASPHSLAHLLMRNPHNPHNPHAPGLRCFAPCRFFVTPFPLLSLPASCCAT